MSTGSCTTLLAAFQNYLGSAGSTKELPALVTEQLQAVAISGDAAVTAVQQCQGHLNWLAMDMEQFTAFYRFTFLIARDVGRRNLPVARAVAGWRLLLRGRFRLLERWCAFVQSPKRNQKIITEDTWRQVLDFSRCVLEDLSNYDPAGAWPVLLDDFVEALQKERPSYSAHRRLSNGSHHACYGSVFLHSPASMLPVSPSAGSKRRCADVETVATQLSHMKPLSQEGERTPVKRMRVCGK